MKIIPGNTQYLGRRNDQQDAFWISDIRDSAFVAHGGVLAIVADGMGGLEKGAEASHLAARAFGECYLAKPKPQSIAETLRQALARANAVVCELSRSVDEFNNVGTTLVAAVIARDALHWIAAGDSRLYLFRNGELTQLTCDHNYGEILRRQVSAGELSAEEAARHPDRNALTSYLGMPELEEIDNSLRPFPLEAGDWVLLCSDGLHGILSEREIALELHGSPQEAADRLVAQVKAKDHPHQDNTTVVIMGYAPASSVPTRMANGERVPLGAWPRIPFLPRSRSLAIIEIGVLAALLIGIIAWRISYYWPFWPVGAAATAPKQSESALPGQPPPEPKPDAAKPPDTAKAEGAHDAAPEKSKQPTIEELMAAAEDDINNNRLMNPPGNNAFEKYKEILKLDPDNAAAKRGVENIGKKYIELARGKINEGEIKTAEQYLENAQKCIPWGTPDLDAARAELEAKKNELAKPKHTRKPAGGAAPADQPKADGKSDSAPNGDESSKPEAKPPAASEKKPDLEAKPPAAPERKPEPEAKPPAASEKKPDPEARPPAASEKKPK
jgi:protein phosphatase